MYIGKGLSTNFRWSSVFRKEEEFMFRSLVAASLLMLLVVLNGVGENEGLLAYLSFDEGSGDVAGDSSGLGNDGEIFDAEWVEGRFGSALSFNGESAYVEITYNEDFSITEGITLAAWVKIDHLPLATAYTGIINGKMSTYGPYLLQTSTLNGLSVYEFSVYLGGAWSWNISETEESTEWTHLVGTYDGENSIIYVNGKLDAEKPLGGNIDANVDEGVVIGHNYGHAGRWFHGLIDEASIYKRAISEIEVRDLYEGGMDIKAVSPELKAAVSWGELKTRY